MEQLGIVTESADAYVSETRGILSGDAMILKADKWDSEGCKNVNPQTMKYKLLWWRALSKVRTQNRIKRAMGAAWMRCVRCGE
jgi:hypothetical protein